MVMEAVEVVVFAPKAVVVVTPSIAAFWKMSSEEVLCMQRMETSVETVVNEVTKTALETL